ncbi:alpha/beta hydrolase [Kytococcus sedentarius]|uniref:alpha/beta hydrolase n=1 Tax=Kytococcus sedentarius TaxID=1276 RepID=UPI0035BC8FB4
MAEGSSSGTTRTVHLDHHGVELTVDLYPLDAGRARLDAGHALTDAGRRPAMLVLPGGGFRELTAHEGEGYARWWNSLGVAAAVLHYRLRPRPFPMALQQARAALDALQSGALMPGVDGARVGVVGSSAGGLLAGLLATGVVLSVEPPVSRVPRPAFHIQSYGVADLDLLPRGAVEALLGEDIGLAGELSPARSIDAVTPPTFVWTTAQDPPGLPNALEWARALAEHEVPVELHVYPEGWHGVGLADGRAFGEHGHECIPHTAQWADACARWLVHLGVLPGPG